MPQAACEGLVMKGSNMCAPAHLLEPLDWHIRSFEMAVAEHWQLHSLNLLSKSTLRHSLKPSC